LFKNDVFLKIFIGKLREIEILDHFLKEKGCFTEKAIFLTVEIDCFKGK